MIDGLTVTQKAFTNDKPRLKFVGVTEDNDTIDFYCTNCHKVIGQYLKTDKPKADLLYNYTYWKSTACSCGRCSDLYLDYKLKDLLEIYKAQCCISALSPSISPWSDIIPPATEKEGIKIDLSCGGAAYDTCGSVKYAVSCENRCKDPKLIYNNCGRLICSECGGIMAYRKGHRVAERLTGLHKAYWNSGIKVGKIRHVVFSPPVDSFSSGDIISSRGRNIYKVWGKIVKKFGRSWGGVPILHLWRKRHLDGTECDLKDCKQPHQWVYGPHMHFIGCGWFVPSDEVYAATGWIYKTIERKNTDSLYDFIKDAIGYQLSHCTTFQQKSYQVDHNGGDDIQGSEQWKKIGQSVRYYGVFSNCKGGKKVIEKSTEIAHCPDCKNEMHKYLCDGETPDFDCDIGEYVLHIELIEWRINFKKKTHMQVMINGEDNAEFSDFG